MRLSVLVIVAIGFKNQTFVFPSAKIEKVINKKPAVIRFQADGCRLPVYFFLKREACAECSVKVAIRAVKEIDKRFQVDTDIERSLVELVVEADNEVCSDNGIGLSCALCV